MSVTGSSLAATGAKVMAGTALPPLSARNPQVGPPVVITNSGRSQIAIGSLNLIAGKHNITSKVPKLDMTSVVMKIQDPTHRFNYTERSLTHAERHAQKESARNTYRPAIAPAWLKHDRQVLRFMAYFQEPVHENPRETFRIRQCNIFFYLEDGTMMVSEPKVENSGIPQGTFVKRHRIPKIRTAMGNSGCFAAEDLRVGITVNVYGRDFRITDADQFTRSFYQTAYGISLDSKEEAPLDSFRMQDIQEPEPPTSPRRRVIAESKEYTELSIGGSRKNAKLQQYLENDRKVLAFKCFWDDPTPYGSRMFYILHYYLADDTVEILESLTQNSGWDPYPVFWRRAPLRKNPYISPAPGMIEPDPVLYMPEDFIVGQVVKVYGREIFLYDCDAFTREFYRQFLDLEQGLFHIQVPPIVRPKLSYPPHTGYGTEEDSLGSCLWLTPRPPRRRFQPPPAEPKAKGEQEAANSAEAKAEAEVTAALAAPAEGTSLRP